MGNILTAGATGTIVKSHRLPVRLPQKTLLIDSTETALSDDIKSSNNLPIPSLVSEHQSFSFLAKASLDERHLVAIQDYFLDLLLDLQGVIQNPRYHPEADALYHSLQVFQWALQETSDKELLAAALFHDVGKAIDDHCHAEVAVQMFDGLLSARVVWLIGHHLDLLRQPKRTRQRWTLTQQLDDLENLRRWDLSGRCCNVTVMSASEAITQLFHRTESSHT